MNTLIMPMFSNYVTYFEFLAKGLVDSYPETTTPSLMDIGDYVQKCGGGDINDTAHVQMLEDQKHPLHRTAFEAEVFFTNQVRAYQQEARIRGGREDQLAFQGF